LVTSKPSKNTMHGAGFDPAAAGSGCTSSAGRLVPPYGTSTDSMRGWRMMAAASRKAFTELAYTFMLCSERGWMKRSPVW
jgi:hypothetical protein